MSDVFSYLDMMKEKEPNNRIFNEIPKILRNDLLRMLIICAKLCSFTRLKGSWSC